MTKRKEHMMKDGIFLKEF